MKSVLIKISKSIFSPGVELSSHPADRVPASRSQTSSMVTSNHLWLPSCWSVGVCVCATDAASVCRPGFLWGQSVTFELPGAVTSWVMTCSGRTLHTYRSSARQPDRQTERNKHRGASCWRSSQPETADWSLGPPRASWPHSLNVFIDEMRM